MKTRTLFQEYKDKVHPNGWLLSAGFVDRKWFSMAKDIIGFLIIGLLIMVGFIVGELLLGLL